MAVNVAADPAPIAGSELFGHEKGAFTGGDRCAPVSSKKRLMVAPCSSAIGELDLALQAKLLRVLQRRGSCASEEQKFESRCTCCHRHAP